MNKVFILFLALTLLTTACSKDETNEAAGTVMVSFKVNGNPVEITSTNGGATASVDALGTVVLLALQTGGNGLTLILSNHKVGKYDLSDDSSANHGAYTSLSDIFTTENKGDGTVEITSSSATNIKGKFSFKGTSFDGKKIITVSEGAFDVAVTK